MKVEYDVKKSESNKSKHGIDFEEAKQIWLHDCLIVPAINVQEKRYMVIGKIKGKVYSCIFTTRDKKIRIISCRRSREKEKAEYYEKIK